MGASAFTGENTRVGSSVKAISHATFVHLASGEAYRIVNVRPRNWRMPLCWACVSSRCLGIKSCQRIVDAWGWQPGSLRLSNRLYFTKRKDQHVFTQSYMALRRVPDEELWILVSHKPCHERKGRTHRSGQEVRVLLTDTLHCFTGTGWIPKCPLTISSRRLTV